MIEYMIVIRDSADELETLVNSYIAKGWKPQGGVSVSYFVLDGEVNATWAQAMMRGCNSGR